MIIMPNGYGRSNFTVVPKNWKSDRASVKKQWRIYYRFYDMEGGKKQIPINGMNGVKTAEGRRLAIEEMIAREIELLEVDGYNPITGIYKPPAVVDESAVHERTLVFKALRAALPWLECVAETRRAVRINIDIMAKCGSGIGNMCVCDIRPKHMMQLLKTVADKRKISAVTYNHYRAYLMMLFKVLIPLGAIEVNPVRDVPKRKTVKKIKKTLTDEQREKVKEVLSLESQQSFYRYVQIFFASGARSTELFSVKVKDVDLSRQQYLCVIRKGRQWVEVYKTIKDAVLPLWQDLLKGGRDEDYIFSHGLVPGPLQNKSNQITRRWRKCIKSKETGLGIDVDFYSLKHLHSTELVNLKGTKTAAAMNSHKGEGMVINIYDTMQDERRHEELKGIGNVF